MSQELELKFLVEDVAAAQAWLGRRLAVDPSEWRTLNITDRYFDTADGALAAAGYGARLRRVGRHTVVTVKSDLEVVGGLHRRLELEAPATRALDPHKWPESEARSRVTEVAGERRLIESFTVKQQRHELEASIAGAVVLVSLDEAQVFAAGREAGELRQLEVELVSGDEAALRALGDEIAAAGLGQPESRSKLVIAAGLAEAAAHVMPNDTMAAAGRIVLRRQLLRMLERETGARTGDVLAIKQMRVATRRMRAGWRVFGAAYRKSARRRYVAELRRVARALGEVRDRDVLLERLPERADLAPLAEAWRAHRAEAQAQLLALLDDKAYGKFVDDYLDFSASADAGLPADATPETLAEAAPARVAAAVERMRAAGAAALGTADAVAWHQLRITARRLRYTIEALREALDGRAAADLIARLVRVQDVLGAMNDAALAAAEAEAWLAAGGGDASAPTSDAVRAYAGEQHAEMARLRRSFAAVWRGASGPAFERTMKRAMGTLPTTRRRVLFLCVHNSSRSQMAEGLLRARAGDQFEPHSAGTLATEVKPFAVRAMAEIGIDISAARSKAVTEYAGQRFDYAVTVCDDAKEACPYFAHAAHQVHWRFDDPAAATGSDDEKLAVYRRVRDEIRAQIDEFVSANRG